MSVTISSATSAPAMDNETVGAKLAGSNPPCTSSGGGDTVQISATAQAAAKAAMQEATESHAQTLNGKRKRAIIRRSGFWHGRRLRRSSSVSTSTIARPRPSQVEQPR